MSQPNFPMTAQWAQVDELVDKYVDTLNANQMTSADIAMDLLACDVPNRLLFLAMLSATALQRLVATEGGGGK